MKAVATALKRVYTSTTIKEAARELDAFEEAWGGKYRAAVRVWRAALEAGTAGVSNPVWRGASPRQ